MQHKIPSSFFTANRKRLAALLRPGSLAVLNSNDVLPSNADGTLKFRQNNDLFYLGGITQDQTTLLLFPDHPDEACREILFILEPNELLTKWFGHKLSREEASAVSGVSKVYFAQEFDTVFHKLMFKAEHVYLNAIEHARAQVNIRTKDDRFASWCKKKYQLHDYRRLAPLMMELRMIKSEQEVQLMRTAAAITEKGFRRLLRFIKPGVLQQQAEAEMIHEYLFNGGTWADYEPIVASGADSCVLHYNSNHKVCHAGEVVLIDAAASYCYYNADMTRTLPVDGRFSKRQKAVYESVLGVHKQIRSLMKPGVLMKTLQQQWNELLLEEYVKLGLCSTKEIREKGAAFYLDRYSYHHFSHFLGLDVHDPGDFDRPFEAGMVFTNEPGIYIAEENLGIRIENNLLINAAGNEDLMATVPLEVEEIEALMNQG